MATIGEAISRVRNGLKSVKEDAFLTDRYIFSVLNKYAKAYIERDKKAKNVFSDNEMFKEIPYMELIDVDVVDNCYTSLLSGCKIKRSKYKLPEHQDIRYVSSIDHSIRLVETEPSQYSNRKKLSSFKYNKSKYFWVSNKYIYIPDVEWDAVAVSASFDEDISSFLCSSTNPEDNCGYRQDGHFNIPEYLLAECEQMTRQELISLFQIVPDMSTDKLNIAR